MLVPEAPIAVAPLPPPPESQLGLATAAAALRAPLWPETIPPDLPLLIGRLPAVITEPSLRELQRNLLAAPTPGGAGARELLLARVDRLLAMAEPATALELLALVPEGGEGPAVEARRLEARFAADRVDEACADRGEAAAPLAPRARLVCAALARDPAAVDLGIDLLASRGEPANPDLAALLRAAAAGERARVPSALPDDPLLLPLLRRMKLDLDLDAVGILPPAAKRALLANQGVSSAVRAAAAAPARPGPSVRPELNGTPPGDWAAAFAGVPPRHRETWAALADGLGLALPGFIWSRLAAAPPAATARAPELAAWRGFEVARAGGERGLMLVQMLLLLDGRPEAAAPVSLRRALDALTSLDLVPEARALAAGTGGALGL